MRERIASGVGFRLFGLRRWIGALVRLGGDAQQLTHPREVFTAVALGEKAVMPNAVEAIGQDMQEKATQELVRAKLPLGRFARWVAPNGNLKLLLVQVVVELNNESVLRLADVRLAISKGAEFLAGGVSSEFLTFDTRLRIERNGRWIIVAPFRYDPKQPSVTWLRAPQEGAIFCSAVPSPQLSMAVRIRAYLAAGTFLESRKGCPDSP